MSSEEHSVQHNKYYSMVLKVEVRMTFKIPSLLYPCCLIGVLFGLLALVLESRLRPVIEMNGSQKDAVL